MALAARARPPEAAPLHVLTGFLGAGKTTLLNRMLRDPALSGAAVLVNEFGEIGIDHLLIEAVRDDLLVLATGCLCCAARGDVLAAIEGLCARRRAGTVAFDRIVIETTGLADPGPVLNALLLGPALSGDVRLDGLLTLVSAVDGDAALDRHDEARRQVALADRVLITKRDLVPARGGGADRLAGRIAALNPSAPVGDVRDAVDVAALLAPSVHVPRAPGESPAAHHHAADARIRAVALEAGPVDEDRLLALVALLQARHGTSLLRLKGVAALRGALDAPVVVQAVGHLLHPAVRLPGWGGLEPRTRLVAILDGVDPEAVSALWDGVFGPPAVDRPDAAALLGGGAAGLFG